MTVQDQWVPISVVAREYQKHTVTLKRWARTGFILHLGFRVRRDPKGQWFLMKVEPEQPMQSKPTSLT